MRLDVDPASGRGFLTGDAVNVAARLQSAAPPMGVVVGQPTHALTDRAIVYEPMAPVLAKGKEQPVAAWLAAGTLARRGIEARSAGLTPLVGREVELAYLSAIFDKATTQSAAQVALIVGEPGIGKSRLVRELSVLVDARPQMTTWRQGYCPPFGEDITYGALTEIVKRHAGIRDNDPVHAVEAKLEAVLPDGPDRQWFRQRLRALLGLEAPEASRDENFAAWTRFFEEVACAEPTVLVFEDLHWADEALLAFLEYLTAHLSAVPLLLVGTARPELFERAPGFASGGPVTRINLGPLSPAETAHLVAGLLDQPVERAKAVGRGGGALRGQPLLRRAVGAAPGRHRPRGVRARLRPGGHRRPSGHPSREREEAPLRRLRDRQRLLGRGRSQPWLSSIHGSWVASLSGLLQRQLIRRLRESSMEGERELAFVHALARDVAYQQLPRAARAARHAAVAGGSRTRPASERRSWGSSSPTTTSPPTNWPRRRATTQSPPTTLDPALDYLVRAGRRAQFFDPPAAKRLFGKARDMAPEGHPLWPRIQLGWAACSPMDLRMNEAAELAEEIIPALKASGDAVGAAEALIRLADMRIYTGREVGDVYEEALALLEVNGPSRDMILALTSAAGWHYLIGRDFEKSLALCERAVEMAADLGLPKPVGVLGIRALVHQEQGYANVLSEYEAVIEEARSQGLKDDIGLLLYNYCTMLLVIRGTRHACAGVDAGLAFAEDARMQFYVAPFRMLRIQMLVDSGEWDLAFYEAPDVVRLLSEADDHQDLLEMNSRLVLAHARRGEIDRASSLAAELEDVAARMSVVPYIRDMVRLASVVALRPRPRLRRRPGRASASGQRQDPPSESRPSRRSCRTPCASWSRRATLISPRRCATTCCRRSPCTAAPSRPAKATIHEAHGRAGASCRRVRQGCLRME